MLIIEDIHMHSEKASKWSFEIPWCENYCAIPVNTKEPHATTRIEVMALSPWTYYATLSTDPDYAYTCAAFSPSMQNVLVGLNSKLVVYDVCIFLTVHSYSVRNPHNQLFQVLA